MNEWMNHPAMKNLDAAKLELIKKLEKSLNLPLLPIPNDEVINNQKH